MKRSIVLVLLVAATAVVATAGAAMQSKPRSGALHVTKECSDYHGEVGQFCTITSSNVEAIKPGMRVVYLAAPGAACWTPTSSSRPGTAAPRSATSCST